MQKIALVGRGGLIAVVSDVVLVREAIADHLRRAGVKPIVVMTSRSAGAVLGPTRQRVAAVVVDMHQLENVPASAAPEAVIRIVRTVCPHAKIVALGTRGELAAQAGEADVLMQAAGASLLAITEIFQAVRDGRDDQLGVVAPAGIELDRKRWNAVSPRERQVLWLLAGGADNLKIAAQLDICERTVKAHVASLSHKLDAANRTQLALLARDAGFRGGW